MQGLPPRFPGSKVMMFCNSFSESSIEQSICQDTRREKTAISHLGNFPYLISPINADNVNPEFCDRILIIRLSGCDSFRFPFVSVPLRGSVFVKSSLRKPYRDWVSAAKSTHLFLLSINQRLLTKISGFHRP